MDLEKNKVSNVEFSQLRSRKLGVNLKRDLEHDDDHNDDVGNQMNLRLLPLPPKWQYL